MQIVSEAEPHDNVAVFDPALTELTQALGRAVRARLRGTNGFAQIEATALALSNESIRRVLQQELEQLAAQPEEMAFEGRQLRKHQPGTIRVHSLVGAIDVERWTYREIGVRNGPTYAPFERAAGLLERSTPALAQAIARGYADRPSRALHDDLRCAARVPPSRSTIERIAVEIGQQVKAAVRRVEPGLRRKEKVDAKARGLTVGLDRTTVPMAEHDDAGELEVRYRMAYVATVTIADGDAEPLHTRRYAAPAHEGPEQILSRLEADVRHTLQQRPDLNVAIVQDGAPEMWNLARPTLRRAGVKKWIERYDRYHVEQRLAAVLEALEQDAAMRAVIWKRWRSSLSNDDRAIYRICAWIEAMRRNCTPQARRAIAPHTMYLLMMNKMRYAALKPLGIPMGSGVTEGACKSLITQRTKRSGQRWRQRGIEAVLGLRSIVHSDRWPRFWRSFAKPLNAIA
jgi:hypothetical protein